MSILAPQTELNLARFCGNFIYCIPFMAMISLQMFAYATTRELFCRVICSSKLWISSQITLEFELWQGNHQYTGSLSFVHWAIRLYPQISWSLVKPRDSALDVSVAMEFEMPNWLRFQGNATILTCKLVASWNLISHVCLLCQMRHVFLQISWPKVLYHTVFFQLKFNFTMSFYCIS